MLKRTSLIFLALFCCFLAACSKFRLKEAYYEIVFKLRWKIASVNAINERHEDDEDDDFGSEDGSQAPGAGGDIDPMQRLYDRLFSITKVYFVGGRHAYGVYPDTNGTGYFRFTVNRKSGLLTCTDYGTDRDESGMEDEAEYDKILINKQSQAGGQYFMMEERRNNPSIMNADVKLHARLFKLVGGASYRVVPVKDLAVYKAAAYVKGQENETEHEDKVAKPGVEYPSLFGAVEFKEKIRDKALAIPFNNLVYVIYRKGKVLKAVKGTLHMEEEEAYNKDRKKKK